MKLLPMSAKEIFEKNFLILARREKIIVCFFDMSQDRKLEILAPDWVQFDPYKGLVLNNMHQFTNLQTSTLMKLLSDYVGEGSYRVSDSKMAVSSEDGKMEDLKITFIGHGIGGCSAQFMALHIKYMHPDMNDDHLNVITLGSELCFDASVAEFYNQRLKAFTLNILHKNDPISQFSNCCRFKSSAGWNFCVDARSREQSS
jgi:hypothetical protein